MCNTRGLEDGKKYKDMQGLSDRIVVAANRPPGEYGLKYIPHKCLINHEGVVVKNFDGVKLAEDVRDMVSAYEASAGPPAAAEEK
mmetsp:Transcript_48766/g.126563  ORF Transcript_48766/g.126563 Transcript_48766/m.126563 type:complete len:85 (-) Transcript_48766:341-595(-)